MGQTVRLQLKNERTERQGLLTIVTNSKEEIPQPIRLSLSTYEFSIHQIETISRLS